MISLKIFDDCKKKNLSSYDPMQRNNIYIDDFAIKQVTKRNVENQENQGAQAYTISFPRI